MAQSSEFDTEKNSAEVQTNQSAEAHQLYKFSFSQGFAVILTGIGIGWLMGLSISPVVGVVITSLLTLSGAAVTAFRQELPKSLKNRTNNAWPIAILTIGLAVGASFGIFARTHDIFGLDYQTTINGKEETVPKSSLSKNLVSKTVLFNLTSDECGEMLIAGPQKIRSIFKTSSHEEIRILGDIIDDHETLVIIAEALCEK
ncbi:hypothetical protein HNR65_002825 [Desulfosalsimonas propionicica]|uniref:Uncharacterized protein n=1 Tax=Desulfosalsimonas propionicica TaxID=332175 RepID=A0A7W0CB57_9BACT|nr:hypothetical protein [Desulfosalsimonas propionicica]MBA2882473.1 hypothetical protein [Desulfosalsimonas propionicica]